MIGPFSASKLFGKNWISDLLISDYFFWVLDFLAHIKYIWEVIFVDSNMLIEKIIWNYLIKVVMVTRIHYFHHKVVFIRILFFRYYLLVTVMFKIVEFEIEMNVMIWKLLLNFELIKWCL